MNKFYDRVISGQMVQYVTPSMAVLVAIVAAAGAGVNQFSILPSLRFTVDITGLEDEEEEK